MILYFDTSIGFCQYWSRLCLTKYYHSAKSFKLGIEQHDTLERELLFMKKYPDVGSHLRFFKEIVQRSLELNVSVPDLTRFGVMLKGNVAVK